MKQSIIILILAFIFTCADLKAQVGNGTEVPQLMNYPSTKVGERTTTGGYVTLRGKIIVPDNSVLARIKDETLVIVRNYIVNTETNTVIDINDDGTFQQTLYVPYPMYALVMPFSKVYMNPGDTIDMTIDATKSTREEGLRIDGTGISGEVNRVTDKVNQTYCNIYYENLEGQTADSLLRWRDAKLEKLDNVVRRMNEGLPELEGLSPLAYDIVRTHILRCHLDNLLNGYFRFGDRDKDVWRQYFSFLADREKMLVDNRLLMIAGDFFTFNLLGYGAFEQIWSTESDYPQAIQNIHDCLNVSENNFSMQVCMLRKVFGGIENGFYPDPDSAADAFASILPHITYPELARCATQQYRDYVKKTELAVPKDKPMTQADSIFQRIIEPYKGNVLFIDFWEMSCGGCRKLMFDMREDVKKNKDKAVKYLYITDDSEEKCRQFLKSNDIQGEHIFITRAEWNRMQEKFNFSSIPFTLIYDKNGNRRYNTTIEKLLSE